MEIAAKDVDYCCYRGDAINKIPVERLSRRSPLCIIAQRRRKYGAAGTEGKNGEKCHRAAVSEWLMENNGWQFIVAILTSGRSTDAGDRILMCAFHHALQYGAKTHGQRLSPRNERRFLKHS